MLHQNSTTAESLTPQATKAQMALINPFAIITRTAKVYSTITCFIEQQRSRRTRHPVRVAALERACTVIARRHPDWAESLFDLHFMQHRAAPLLEPFLHGGAMPMPQAIAEAWATQFHYLGRDRAALAARVLPVAEEFVQILQREVAQFEASRQSTWSLAKARQMCRQLWNSTARSRGMQR